MMTSHLSMVKLCLLFACFLLFTNEASAMHGFHADDSHDMMIDPMTDMDSKIGLYKRSRVMFCGKYLTYRLELLCKGIYNKRSSPPDADTSESIPMARITDMEMARYPFVARHAALSWKPVHDRRKRAIVDECCKKSCTIEEMANYCG